MLWFHAHHDADATKDFPGTAADILRGVSDSAQP
jgi:hypothetical protein